MSAALMLPPKAADYVTCLDVTTLMKHMLLPCCYRCYHPWLQHLLPVMMSLNSADSLLPCITPEGLQNICYLSWCYHPGLQHSEFVFLTNIFFRHINYTLFWNRRYSMNCFVFTFVLAIFNSQVSPSSYNYHFSFQKKRKPPLLSFYRISHKSCSISWYKYWLTQSGKDKRAAFYLQTSSACWLSLSKF